jgi:opacity protein-like surface antigen
MRKTVFASMAVAIALTAGQADAQMGIPLSVEGRLDYAVPVGDFDDAVDEGTSWGAGVSFAVSPGIAVYGTYSQTRFEIEDSDIDVSDDGFSVGLTAGLPVMGGGISPWLGAGVLIHTLEVDGENEGIDQDVGFEVGGGLAIPLAPNIRLTPGIGYRQYGVDVGTLLGEAEFDVQYFTAGVGLNLSF